MPLSEKKQTKLALASHRTSIALRRKSRIDTDWPAMPYGALPEMPDAKEMKLRAKLQRWQNQVAKQKIMKKAADFHDFLKQRRQEVANAVDEGEKPKGHQPKHLGADALRKTTKTGGGNRHE